VKRPALLAVPLMLLAYAGCGSSDAGPSVDKSDLPGSALACIQDKGIEAERRGEEGNEIVLSTGQRIRFYITADEAIAAQFRGRGEGAEQIGTALLFVDAETSEETDDLLHDVETCLADL
jgi:hypothetical protein